MTKDEAMKLALEALEHAEHDAAHFQSINYGQIDAAITAIREALAEPEQEQEPVAHCRVRPLQGGQSFPTVEVDWASRPIPGPLYTSPPARKPLTDEEIDEAWKTSKGWRGFARAIEAKLKEKNT